MTQQFLSATDIDISLLNQLLTRADELQRGQPSTLANKRIGIALTNTSFPLPVDASTILANAGAEPVNLASSITNLAAAVREANVDAVLFSSPTTGDAAQVAQSISVPMLNAGDGTNENVVRALGDAYAIHQFKPDWQTTRTAILGNLKFSAEAHSLAQVLGQFGTRLSFISPAALSMPYDLTDQVRAIAYEVEETNDLETTLRKTDVLYLSNIDAIRVEKKIYDKQKTFYALTPEMLANAKEGLVILGEWDGAEALLAPTLPQAQSAHRAMLVALVERAVSKDR